MPEWIGKTIGNVRIEKLLARGGMAEVYLGSHLTLERPVAIKLLHSYVEEDPALRERFHREAKVVAGLRHPNIVQVFDFDTTDGHPYIVMEYLRGPTLATYLRHFHQRKKRLSSEQIAHLLKGLTGALDYAHRQGVIHRDIKPGNIMLHNKKDEIPLDQPLPEDVEPIVTDFGLVRIMNAATQTASGFLSGTPAYMSPEQARGTQLDQRTDIYSLGVVLYEMLAGRVPFEADNTVAVMHMHIHTPPPPIPGIAANVQAVLDRALAKNPEDRYATSQELASAYDTAIGRRAQEDILHESFPASPPPAVPARSQELEPVAATPLPQSEPEPVSPAESRAEQAPAPGRSRTLIWIAAGVFALVCLGLLAFGASRLLAARPLALSARSTETSGPAATATGLPSSSPTAALALPAADRMAAIPAGAYEVGTSAFSDEYHAAPTTVELGDFWIDQYQTTNGEYEQYMTATGAPQPAVWPGKPDHPVTGVTWDQAQAYCSWMKKRLPTEAEWEAAGRGPGTAAQPYPWGTDPTAGGQALNLPDQETYPVGSLAFNKSPFGVFDLVANVWEWVGESYVPGQEALRILRGGRYGLLVDLSYRLAVSPDDTRYLRYAGFRCAADQVQ
jgi:serine/threonine-protein kinase